MWCWGRKETVSWIERVQNGVLHRVKEARKILHAIRRRKTNWIGHILRRNCLLIHVIDGNIAGKIERTGRRGRRRKQLLGDLKEKIGCRKLKEEAFYAKLTLEEAIDLSQEKLWIEE